jgi:oligoendopeptidase F
MATAPAALDAYREEADRFIAALDEEYYRHFAGLKDEFELSPIYERYADLATLDACRRLAERAELGGRGETELWRFACEGYMGNFTRAEAEEIARLEASLTVEVGGEEIGFRLLRPALANEPNRARREDLDRARVTLTEAELHPHHLRIAETRREAARTLGFETYRDLYARFGFPLERLAGQCERFLAETEDLYVAAFDRLFRHRVGVPLEEAKRWDLPRLFRAPEWDPGFSAAAMVPALEATLAGLGIDLRAQENVELDLEPRPTKTPRAFCAPIEVPGRVVLVIQPMGGPDDWHALFHEAGHTEHYAHTAPDLPVEARRLGDNAVTEGWAMLLELLVNDPVWLSRRLDFARPDEFAAEAATCVLYFVRRYAAKFLYELELHAGGALDELPARYRERMYDALKVEVSPTDYLTDIDAGFYSSSYLRAWAFEALLRAFLREEFGRAWFARPEAGSLLRELWSEGQRPTADELVDEVVGVELELDAVAERIRETVTP